MPTDIIARGMAYNAEVNANDYTDEKVEAHVSGLSYQGAVNTYADLPTASVSIKGHCYNIKTTSGTYTLGMYVCDGSAWSIITIKGDDGAAGAKGDKGDTGTSGKVTDVYSGSTSYLDSDNKADLSPIVNRIANLENLGRFLSILDASNGHLGDQPSSVVGSTYTYKVGDYYRVGASGYYTPKGNLVFTVDSTYGSSNFEVGSVSYGIGDVIYCSQVTSTATVWVKQSASGGGTVQDVQVNGTSILNEGIANIGIATTSSIGLVKGNTAYGIYVSSENGSLYPQVKTYANYQSATDLLFMCKGTLENVLTNEAVRMDTASQGLTTTQQSNARTNINAVALAEYDSTATAQDNYLYYTTETVVSE